MNKRKHYHFNKIIYVDMDGVLADFKGQTDALKRFKVEKDFFENLEPFVKNLKTIKQLLADGNNIKILSISPNEQADGSKRKWLKRYIPKLAKRDIIILRAGSSKSKYANRESILFDDYGVNIHEWVAADGIAWKVKADGDIAAAIETLADLL